MSPFSFSMERKKDFHHRQKRSHKWLLPAIFDSSIFMPECKKVKKVVIQCKCVQCGHRNICRRPYWERQLPMQWQTPPGKSWGTCDNSTRIHLIEGWTSCHKWQDIRIETRVGVKSGTVTYGSCNATWSVRFWVVTFLEYLPRKRTGRHYSSMGSLRTYI